MNKTSLTPVTSSDKLRQAAAAEEPLHFREPPHNIEAEQALLGPSSSTTRRWTASRRSSRPIHFFDPPPWADLRDDGEAHPRGQACHADHAQDVLRERRADRSDADRAAVSRPPRRECDDRHQRRGLWPDDLRSRRAPPAHHARRGHGQPRLRRAHPMRRPSSRSTMPKAASTSLPSAASTARGS